MNCAYHPDIESSAFCSHCGKALCTPCARSVRGNIYCDDCIVEGVEKKSAGARRRVGPIGGTSPEAAFVLGLIPGVGAIYNAEYFKAAIHLMLFGSLVTIVDRGGVASPLFGMLAFGFYVYMPFEAYFTAKKRKLAREGVDLETPFDPFNDHLGQVKNKELWGGISLVVIGSLFLLDNFGLIRIQSVAQLWPVLLIIAGVFMIRRFQEKAS